MCEESNGREVSRAGGGGGGGEAVGGRCGVAGASADSQTGCFWYSEPGLTQEY